MTHDDIKARIAPTLNVFKAVRDAVDLAEKTVNTVDRERIAELERDLAHARASQSETTARTIIAFCNEAVGFAALGNSHVETAVKSLYHRLTEANANLVELRTNFAQNAAITEALRVELAEMRGLDEPTPPIGTYRCDGCGSLWDEKHALVKESPTFGSCHCCDSPRYVYDLPSYVSLRPFVEPIAVVEEQGPWVVYDPADPDPSMRFAGLGSEGDWDWIPLDSIIGFPTKAEAEKVLSWFKGTNRSVITMAEAQRIAAVKP